MKIKIGKTNEELMELFKWHPWFAWYPLIVDGHFVLFSKVNRRLVNIGFSHQLSWKYEII
jgi:hypothetical protein